MQVLESGAAELAPEFGILAGRWERQYAALGDMPFGAMWCMVPPGEKSDVDRHPERELVVFVAGQAEVHASGRAEPVSAGSAVLMDGEEEHVIVNTGGEPVVMLSLYWIPGATDAG